MVYFLEAMMVRTQIYLTRDERNGLELMAAATGMKISKLVRMAINRMIDDSAPARRQAVLSKVAGLWKDRTDLPDFAATRAEWDRNA